MSFSRTPRFNSVPASAGRLPALRWIASARSSQVRASADIPCASRIGATFEYASAWYSGRFSFSNASAAAR